MTRTLIAPIPDGHYIVAVSGGVDSVALLHALVEQARVRDSERGAEPGRLRLTVAHYDHGIRPDSGDDRLFVQQLAASYEIPFVYDEGRLGASCSEATAREHRHAFLEKVQAVSGADAIIMAHHADDVLETVIINILRGTGPKGLAALKSGERIMRPLLDVTKNEIMAYATKNALQWHEDSTNQDEKYLRNYVRQRLLPAFGAADRRQLAVFIQSTTRLDKAIDETLKGLIDTHVQGSRMDRQWFTSLPHDVSLSIMHAWLRQEHVSHDRQRIERVVIGAKTLPKGKIVDIDNRYIMEIGDRYLALQSIER